MPYIINNGYVAARLFQEQFDNLSTAMFTSTHQGRGSLIILYVNICTALQQGPHHLLPPVANS